MPITTSDSAVGETASPLRRSRPRPRRNFAALAWALAVGVEVAAAQPVAIEEEGKPTLAPLLRRVTPAVVNVAVVSKVTAARNPLLDDPFFRRFFDIPDRPEGQTLQQSAGSGVIIDASGGYVLTNRHLIENADQITVNLKDRRQLVAKLIGSDAATDIALLQIEASGLTALEMGDSDALLVGDFVVAIGNPFALGQTVTSGIVSALGRSGLNIEGLEDFIQTDASINPGNSGGALVDLDGKLIGINSAIVSPSGGNVGIGFAIPSKIAQSVMEQLLEYGEVRRGRLGVSVRDLTPDLAKALRLQVDSGAVVTEVQPGSAAAKAGLAAGDIITAVNGRPIIGATDLRNRIGLTRVGDIVEITALRDGRSTQFRARIEQDSTEQAARAQAPAQASTPADEIAGAQLRNLAAGDPQYGRVQGVLVVQVDPGSAAARNGLQANDVIVAVNRQAVASVAQLNRALRNVDRTYALDVLRNNGRMFLIVR